MTSRGTSRIIGAVWLTAAVAEAEAQGQVLRVRVVVDSSKVPIAAATILLVGLQLAATTDSLGRFRLPGVTRARHEVLVRRLGFVPSATTIAIDSADSTEVEFTLKPAPQLLSEITVPTTRIARKLVPFHERRRLGIGYFRDSNDIAAASGTRLSEKLRELPGLVISCGVGRCALYSSRWPRTIRSGAACPVGFIIDGVRVHDFQLNDLSPHDVAAVEWYAGPAQVPVQFDTNTNTCGLMIVWTK
jgi:hypothetical protein